MRTVLWLSVGLMGCPMGPDDGDTDSDTQVQATVDGIDPATIVDCAQLPAPPNTTREVPSARGYHGLAIDAAGAMVGSDGESLIRAWSDGTSEVWIPALGELEGFALLDDGGLVASSAETGELFRLTAEGGREPLVSELWAYSVVRGPDDAIYTGGFTGLSRIDLQTGEEETVLRGRAFEGNELHAMGFDLEGERLVMGVIAWGGEEGPTQAPLHQAEVMGDGSVEAAATKWVANVGSGWHDVVAVDACGNVYVADFFASDLYRVTPDGDVSLFFDWVDPFGSDTGRSKYGHAAVWGTGQDGWRNDALYMAMPYAGNTVQEVVIGVPSQDWPGEAANR